MPTGYQIYKQDACHYVTFQVVYWIDVFSRKELRDIIVDSLNYCIANKGLNVFAYVIMSNHVHLLISADKSNPDLNHNDIQFVDSFQVFVYPNPTMGRFHLLIKANSDSTATDIYM